YRDPRITEVPRSTCRLFVQMTRGHDGRRARVSKGGSAVDQEDHVFVAVRELNLCGLADHRLRFTEEDERASRSGCPRCASLTGWPSRAILAGRAILPRRAVRPCRA